MRRFFMARSDTMGLRAASASILSCTASTVAIITALVAATIFAQIAVSSSRFILQNIALVVKILTLFD